MGFKEDCRKASLDHEKKMKKLNYFQMLEVVAHPSDCATFLLVRLKYVMPARYQYRHFYSSLLAHKEV